MKRALLSIFILSYSSVALAEDPPELPPDVFTQVLSQTYNGRIYSPAAQFGNLLEIGVFADFVNIVFGDGLPIPVDVHPIAQRVAQMWDDQLAAARIPVRVRLAEQAVLGNLPVRTANAAQERAMIGDDPDDASSAITTPILPDEALEEYMYVNFRQPGIVLLPTRRHTDEQFQRFVQIFGTDNRQTIADALVFRTLAHEVGHALGLNHPNDTSEEPFDTAGRITLGWARTTTFTRDIAATPLMIGDQMAYLEALAARLRTPVTTANMAPTVHELFAIGVENDCGGPISQSSSNDKTSMSDDTCTNKPRIFYPLAARLSAAIGMSVLK